MEVITKFALVKEVPRDGGDIKVRESGEANDIPARNATGRTMAVGQRVLVVRRGTDEGKSTPVTLHDKPYITTILEGAVD